MHGYDVVVQRNFTSTESVLGIQRRGRRSGLVVVMGKDMTDPMYWYQSRQGRFVAVEPGIEGKRVSLGTMRELQEHRAEAGLGELWQIDRPPSRNPRYFLRHGKREVEAASTPRRMGPGLHAHGIRVCGGSDAGIGGIGSVRLGGGVCVWASGIVVLGSLGGQWQVSQTFRRV